MGRNGSKVGHGVCKLGEIVSRRKMKEATGEGEV